MPCEIYLDGETLRIDFLDVVTHDDVATAAAKVEALERDCPVVPHRIVVLEKATGLKIGFPEIFTLAERRKTKRFRNAFKSAIVAPQPVQLGLGRMFQTLNEHPQITMAIFPDLAAAQAWIAQP